MQVRIFVFFDPDKSKDMHDKLSHCLTDNIKRQLSEKEMSVRDLEKRAGLKHSAIQNILHGRSKNPSIWLIQLISKELGCAIEDLIGKPCQNTPRVDAHINSQKISWDKNLFIDAICVTQEIFDQKNITVYKEEALRCIEEVYQYSLGVKKKADKRFAEWIIEKYFLKKLI